MTRTALALLCAAALAAGCGDDDGSGQPGPLELGTEVEYENWTVAVVSVEPSEDVLPYEPLPGQDYEGFLVTVQGTYQGEGESDLWVEFSVKYVGADQRIYQDFDSYSSMPLPSSPMVVAGGTQTAVTTLAIPAGALGAGVVYRSSWSAAPGDPEPGWQADL